jgi:hypothetical protein
MNFLTGINEITLHPDQDFLYKHWDIVQGYPDTFFLLNYIS